VRFNVLRKRPRFWTTQPPRAAQKLQRHFAIRGFAAQLETVALPVNVVSDTFPGHDLILNKKRLC